MKRTFLLLAITPLLTNCSAVSLFYPPMAIYLREVEGRAAFSQAEQDRQIRVLEAQAKLDSAKLESQAEVARAHGVAEANKIIGDSLKGNESYLRYLWINGLSEGKNQVIYVPTEANLPVLEAGKR